MPIWIKKQKKYIKFNHLNNVLVLFVKLEENLMIILLHPRTSHQSRDFWEAGFFVFTVSDCEPWHQRRRSKSLSEISKPKPKPSAKFRKASILLLLLLFPFKFPNPNSKWLHPSISLSTLSSSSDFSKNHQVRKQYTIQLGENELVHKVSCLFSRQFGWWMLWFFSF